MQRYPLRLLMICLFYLLAAMSLSACGGMTQMLRPQHRIGINTEAMFPKLRSDPVGAPLQLALQEYPNFFARFSGGPFPDEAYKVLLYEVKEREAGRQAGNYEEAVNKVIADYRTKGWFNDERAQAYKNLFMHPGYASFDNRGIIAKIERARAEGSSGITHGIIGLPDAPAAIQPYKIGNVTKLVIANTSDPTKHNTTAVLFFSLPIPQGTNGADHVRRLLSTAFLEEYGWTATQEVVNKYNFNATFSDFYTGAGFNAPEVLTVKFETLYDDLGFVWVTMIYVKPQ